MIRYGSQNLSDLLSPPSPLSLEELLARKGKPVWICQEDRRFTYSGWAIAMSLSSGGAFFQFNAGCEKLPISEYGRTWVAFDREPEEVSAPNNPPSEQSLLEKLRSSGQLPAIGPVSVKIPSDYDPNTFLRLTQTDDGDIILKVVGNGEMRIATSGGYLHGMDLVAVIQALGTVIDTYKKVSDKQES